ncbi:MAG: formylglycine-generating enzyme family protein [Crocinitomicaceae bacterium]|nr:formylglycine-generating enzyme family protein [Crocinitomicaceae bacterium]
MGCLITLFIVASFGCFSQNNQLIFVKGGNTTIGTSAYMDSQPVFKTKVSSFWMQEHEVTNNEFHQFVQTTNYVTLAEKNGGSYVFNPTKVLDSSTLIDALWWYFEKGTNWQHPEGATSSIEDKGNHPVTHISHEDAMCYCNWLGMRLPTEVEREYVALKDNNHSQINNWQGDFPTTNTLIDGFSTTAPVKSFAAGRLGFYDLQGNVWEWCLDPYHQNAYQYVRNWKLDSTKPLVPNYYDEFSPDEETFVIRGGSFLCSDETCRGYEPEKRMRSSSTMTFQHIGFRCVK